MILKKTGWIVFVALAIIVGLYPSIYFILSTKFGLLTTKNDELFKNMLWHTAFYLHIVTGGLALLIGWVQFNQKLLKSKPNIHRQIGKFYIIATLISALSSLYIAFYATGGVVSTLGFLGLGIVWLYTTSFGFIHIKNKNVTAHKAMMIYSYAACFAAVTLRIWLPVLVILLKDFTQAYRIVAWLCWVPNLLVAYFIVKRQKATL
jgi:uncharacterized membrane protein